MYTANPYRRTNPRTVRGARKKGWHIVKVTDRTVENFNTSWCGVEMWNARQAKGNWCSSFMLREFAFENVEDASWFTMKWGI